MRADPSGRIAWFQKMAADPKFSHRATGRGGGEGRPLGVM